MARSPLTRPAACHHVALLIPAALPKFGLSHAAKAFDLTMLNRAQPSR